MRERIRQIVELVVTKRLVLGIICFGMTICYGYEDLYKDALSFRNNSQYSTDDERKETANNLILGGILKGAMLNGIIEDKIGGVLAPCDHQMAKAIILGVLLYGDTATANTRIFNEKRIEEGGILNFANMGFVTVRDWKKRDWFNNVLEINLQDNQCNEIPASFFRMFPKLQKINLSNNPITHLDTTSMPYGLVVVAQNTRLQTILGTNLATLGLVVNAYNTPLARNVAELKRLREACTAYRKNPILNCLDRCFCQDPDEQPDISSVINT